MGVMKEPYDALFAVKLSVDYEPLRAIEVPRAVPEAHHPHGTRTSWTKVLSRTRACGGISRGQLPV